MNTSWTGAEFSPCRSWRYALWRRWSTSKVVLFVCLNPSTADETTNDPTIRRCIEFAKSWGYGGIYMANLFAYRSTDPKALLRVPDPVGPENDRWIQKLSREAGLTVAAWGNHGVLLDRGSQVLKKLIKPHAFGTTKMDQPKHPLYLRADSSIKPLFQ